MSAHKMGSWYVGGNGRDVLQFDEGLDKGQLIATVASYVYSEGHTSQGPETARLIAAAPDLLEALTALVTFNDAPLNERRPEGYGALLASARSAIAKATGATP